MPRLSPEKWSDVEGDIRAGRGTLRAIAARHGVTEGALRKRIKAKGIQIDLKQEVDERFERKLLVPEVRAASTQVRAEVRTDEQIIEDAAAEREMVVRIHRRDIRQAAGLVALLAEQAMIVANNRDLLEDLVVANTDPKAQQARAAMMKAIMIPAQAGTMRDLSTAMKNLIACERQAFGIGDGGVGGGIEEWLRRLEAA